MEALIHHYTKACEFEGWIMWCQVIPRNGPRRNPKKLKVPLSLTNYIKVLVHDEKIALGQCKKRGANTSLHASKLAKENCCDECGVERRK
jgi:hypothetical protein